jgi:hypothetical protein
MKRIITALVIALTLVIGAPIVNAQDAVCVDPNGWVVACSTEEYKVLQPQMDGPNLWSATIVVKRNSPLMSTRDKVVAVYGRTCDEAQDRARQLLRMLRGGKDFMEGR